jgi:hypothetical protein
MQRAPMQHATLADATRNASRCTMQIAGVSCSAHRACSAVQHSASRWGCPSAAIRKAYTLHAGRMRRTPYTTRRSMRALHDARHVSAVPHRATHHTPLSAVPHRATHHTTARDGQLALGARTRGSMAMLFEIEPPLNVTAPSNRLTTPPYCAHAGAATPIAIGPAPRPPTPAPPDAHRPDSHRRTASNAH